MITVRRAAVRDLPVLASLAHEFYAESSLLKVFDPARFITLWAHLIESETGAIFIPELDGKPVGGLGAVMYPDTYSASVIATEFFLYISKAARGGSGLLRLLRAFEQWAREKGCAEIRLGHLQDLQPEALGRLYGKLGFHEIERTYAKNIRP